MKTFAFLFLLLASSFASSAADTTRTNQEDDIREAVFRYQIDNYNCIPRKVYFLALTLTNNYTFIDPSDEVMKRFAGHKPPVWKISAARPVKGEGFFDKQTGDQGVIFSIDGIIEWISDTEVEVNGSFLCPMPLRLDVYTVKKVKGKWEVTNDKQGYGVTL